MECAAKYWVFLLFEKDVLAGVHRRTIGNASSARHEVAGQEKYATDGSCSTYETCWPRKPIVDYDIPSGVV